jgi:hypothetical protein
VGGTGDRCARFIDRRKHLLTDRSQILVQPLEAVADDNDLLVPRVSPDGHRVAAYRTVQGNTDIWLLDGTRTSRFTVDPARARGPIWSPEGSRIVFDSLRTGHRDLYQKSSRGAASEELLLASPQDKAALEGISIAAIEHHRAVAHSTCVGNVAVNLNATRRNRVLDENHAFERTREELHHLIDALAWARTDVINDCVIRVNGAVGIPVSLIDGMPITDEQLFNLDAIRHLLQRHRHGVLLIQVSMRAS